MSTDPHRQGPLGDLDERKLAFDQRPLMGGMNSWLDPKHIGDDQSSEIINADLTDPSNPSKRKGYGEVGAGRVGTTDVTHLADFNPGPQSRLMVATTAFQGGTYVSSDPRYVAWTEAMVTDAPGGSITPQDAFLGDRPKMFSGGDLLWIIGNIGTPVYAMRTSSNMIDCGNVDESPPSDAIDGTWLFSRPWFLTRNRMYWGKILAGEDDLTPTPGAFDRKTIPTDSGVAGFLDVAPNEGSEAIGMVPWRDQLMLVFGSNQVEAFSLNAADPLLSSRSVIERRFGCIARDSITPIGAEVYFLDQFCEIRAISQSITGEQRGIVALPLSQPLRGWIPERVNKATAHRSFSVIDDEKVLFFFPRDTAEYPDTVAVFNPGRSASSGKPVWEGIWQLGSEMRHGIESDICGSGCDLFGAGPGGRVFSFEQGLHSDDGEAIVYSETSKAYDWGRPQASFMPTTGQTFTQGDIGATAKVHLRTGYNDSYRRVHSEEVVANADSDFPLVSGDFDLETADFPLTGSTAQVGRGFFDVDAPHNEGDFGMEPASLPISEHDLPILDGEVGVEPGAFIQYLITESTVDKAYTRKSMFCAANVLPMKGYAE